MKGNGLSSQQLLVFEPLIRQGISPFSSQTTPHYLSIFIIANPIYKMQEFCKTFLQKFKKICLYPVFWYQQPSYFSPIFENFQHLPCKNPVVSWQICWLTQTQAKHPRQQLPMGTQSLDNLVTIPIGQVQPQYFFIRITNVICHPATRTT